MYNVMGKYIFFKDRSVIIASCRVSCKSSRHVDCKHAVSIIRARSPSEILYTRSHIDQPAETSQTFRLKKSQNFEKSTYDRIRFK